MKKAAVVAGVLVVALVLFVASLVVVVRVRGGLSPQRAGLAELPLVGALLPVRSGPEPDEAAAEAAAAAPLPAGREAPFLRFGPQARLERLAEELKRKVADYEGSLRELERRARELDGWEQQIKQERDALRERFAGEKEELVALRDELAARQAELAGRQVLIEQSEETNLKKTADIYGKMAPESAAQVLKEMYANQKQDAVVKIVYLMQERSAAKTLEALALSDPAMSAEITDRLKRVGQSPDREG